MVHVGLVRGSPYVAFLQCFGRANILYAVMAFISEVQPPHIVLIILVASLTVFGWAREVMKSCPWQYRKLPAVCLARYDCWQAQKGWPVSLLFAVWALADVIRYAWYSAAQFGKPPGALTWLR